MQKFSNISNNKSDTQFQFYFWSFDFLFLSCQNSLLFYMVRNSIWLFPLFPLFSWRKLASILWCETAYKIIVSATKKGKRWIIGTKKIIWTIHINKKNLLWNIYICFRFLMTDWPPDESAIISLRIRYWITESTQCQKKPGAKKMPSIWLWSINEIINDQVLWAIMCGMFTFEQRTVNTEQWTNEIKPKPKNKKSLFYHLYSVHCFFLCH